MPHIANKVPHKNESGSQGRKRRKIEDQRAKLARSLGRYIMTAAESTGTNDEGRPESLCWHVDCISLFHHLPLIAHNPRPLSETISLAKNLLSVNSLQCE